MTVKKSIFVLFLFGLMMFGCSDEPTSIGIDLLGNDKINLITINSTNDSLPQTSSYLHQKFSLGSGDRLLLGRVENGNVDASLLLKFETILSDSIKEDIMNDSISVTGVVMELYQNYTFGEASDPFDFSVYKTTSNWTVDFDEDSLSSLTYDGENLSLQKDINDSLTSVTLNNQLLLDWLHSTADTSLRGNMGIYIIPSEGSSKILGYQAITSSFTDVPIIKVAIEKEGSYKDTLIYLGTADVSVVKGNVPSVPNEDIILRAGYMINSRLKFDLSAIPENVVINSAKLILTLDTLESKEGSSPVASLAAYFLIDDSPDSVSSSTVTFDRNGNLFTGDITTYVRAWQVIDNNGILLSMFNPFSSVELLAIKGSNADLTNKPRLEITYTKLK